MINEREIMSSSLAHYVVNYVIEASSNDSFVVGEKLIYCLIEYEI